MGMVTKLSDKEFFMQARRVVCEWKSKPNCLWMKRRREERLSRPHIREMKKKGTVTWEGRCLADRAGTTCRGPKPRLVATSESTVPTLGGQEITSSAIPIREWQPTKRGNRWRRTR